ncbi:hypothetical protein LG272_09835 [Pseudidiomarina marina]|uniref:hypothetical protein n=1 Tax=Pseudidiomarina marina TaxID=502366 RepID=UPI00384CA2C1
MKLYSALILSILLNQTVNAANPHELAVDAITMPAHRISMQQCGVMAPVTLYLPMAHEQQVLNNLSQWHRHPLAQFVNCFSVQTYQSEQLQCELTGSRQRMSCEWHADEDRANRVIVFVTHQQGLASSTSTQIILPVEASLSLLAHEIGHWLGLVDEYAMAPELARNFCLGRYEHDSANVVITDEKFMSEVQLQQFWRQLPWHFAVDDWRHLATEVDENRWRLGTRGNAIGLHPVATCDAVEGRYAWRPVANMTPMQYYDINQWPELYLELIAHSR